MSRLYVMFTALRDAGKTFTFGGSFVRALNFECRFPLSSQGATSSPMSSLTAGHTIHLSHVLCVLLLRRTSPYCWIGASGLGTGTHSTTDCGGCCDCTVCALPHVPSRCLSRWLRVQVTLGCTMHWRRRSINPLQSSGSASAPCVLV